MVPKYWRSSERATTCRAHPPAGQGHDRHRQETMKLVAIILTFNLYHRFQAEEIEICTQASNLIALAFEKFKAMEYE